MSTVIPLIVRDHEEELSELCELDVTGHTPIQWSKDNPDQVKAAKARFDELKAKRYMAYRVNRSGGQGEIIHDFDPNAERIILNPPMVGG